MKSGSAQFTLLTLDGTSLLGAKVKEFNWKPEALQEDTTGLGDAWIEQTPTGIRRASVSQNGAYFDTTLGGMHAVLNAMPLPARTLTWSPDGAKLFTAKGTLTTAYEVLATNGALTKANVTYTISGALDTGGVVQGPAAQTGNWTGATVDSGAASAAGGTTTQLVTEKGAGVTSFAGKIRHSPDGTAWTDLIVFAPVTGAAPHQQSMPVVGTVQRYLQFVGTITGTGTVRVAAGVFRT